MFKLMLSKQVVDPLRMSVSQLLHRYGEALSCEVVTKLEPLMIYETGSDMEILRNVKLNLLETLVVMCFNRLVESLGVDGAPSVLDRISRHKFILGISCRYGDVETLLGKTLTESIASTEIIYEVYSSLTGFLEKASLSDEFKEVISYGLMQSLIALTSYRDFNLRDISGSVLIQDGGVMLFMRNNYGY